MSEEGDIDNNNKLFKFLLFLIRTDVRFGAKFINIEGKGLLALAKL